MADVRLNSRVRFERRTGNSGGAGGDAFGRPGGGWSPFWGVAEDPERGERWARLEPKTGRETSESRLEGRQGWEIVVRLDPETRAITMNDRAVTLTEDLASAIYLNIKAVSPFPPDPDAFLLLTCEAGGADG